MWIEMTEDEVLTRLSGPEVTALKTSSLATGQADPLPEIIAGVVREVRGRVAACAANTLGDGDTIPDELKDHALAIIRYRLCTRLPKMKALLDDLRVKEYDDAMGALRDAASCKFAIQQPSIASSEVVSSPSPSIAARTRTHTRTHQEGI